MKAGARRRLPALFAAAAGGLLATSASAAEVVLNSVLDLSLAGITATSMSAGTYFGFPAALPLTTAFDVAEGDTFTWNLDFKGDQVLTVENLILLMPVVLTQASQQPAGVRINGRIDLLDIDGLVVATAQKTDLDGAVILGQLWDAPDFGSPASLTFAGFHYSGLIEEYTEVHPAIPDYVVRTYDGPAVLVAGSRVSVRVAVPAPEPAAWALMLAGFGFAGATLRRRRAAAA